MSKALFIGTLAFALGACSGGEAKEATDGGPATNVSSVRRSLESGTRVSATIQGELSSRVNKEESPRSASRSKRSYGNCSLRGSCRAISSTGSPRISSPCRLTRAPAEITTSGLSRKRK